MVLTVTLEMCTRISNMLSAFLGVKCLHTCNHFISTEQGAVGDRKGKRSVRPQTKHWDKEQLAIAHLMALACPVSVGFYWSIDFIFMALLF